LEESYKVPFESRSVDIRVLAETGQLNLEDAGRRARIAFFDELREKHGASAVALAHHADDQAETVMMRLLRGSGITGLSGMAYRNARGYVRPMLEIAHSKIMLYLCERKLGWREDTSNNDTTFMRSRVRHMLLPILEEYNPAIRKSLSVTASVLSDDEALLGELTEQAFNQSCRTMEGKIICSAVQLCVLSLSLRRRVLRHAFKQLTGTMEGLSRSHIDALCDMIDSERPNSRLSLPQLVSAMKEYDIVTLTQLAEPAAETTSDLLINAPGHYMLPTGGYLTIEITEPAGDFKNLPANTAFFDPDRTLFPWHVRTFRPGDRIIQLGMSGRKKVKDIFIDQKIPLSERRRIPLLFCGTDLIWIAGVCVSELCRIDTPSAAVVKVRWQHGRTLFFPPNT